MPIQVSLFALCKLTSFSPPGMIVSTWSQQHVQDQQATAMDNDTVQQLANAINALTAMAMAFPPALVLLAAPAPPDPLSLLYEGGPLNLTSLHSSSLFSNGCTTLDMKFMGKVDALQLFLADLKTCSKTCHWDSAMHGILSITSAGLALNLLDDYGKLSKDQVKAAHVLRSAPATSTRARQNALMMYECVKASITEDTKSALASCNTDFHKDGPMLFFHIMNWLFMATFSNAQVTRDNLAEFHPKCF